MQSTIVDKVNNLRLTLLKAKHNQDKQVQEAIIKIRQRTNIDIESIEQEIAALTTHCDHKNQEGKKLLFYNEAADEYQCPICKYYII